MDTAVLICCIISMVLLVIVLIRLSGSDKKNSSEDVNRLIEGKMESLEKMNTETKRDLKDEITRKGDSTVEQIRQLGESIAASQSRGQSNTSGQIEKLEGEFNKIREEITGKLIEILRSNSEGMEKMQRENKESLEKINETVNEKLQKTLNDRISQSFETVRKQLSDVYEGLGEMKNVASGVTDLKNVLSNVKTRGIMGEIQLGNILSEILIPEQYEEQICVAPRRTERVDFAVKLPGAEDGECIYLPIDSKFPADTYSNLIDAYNSGSPEALKEKRKLLEKEIIGCAKSIHDKYIVPPYTTGFAIMFLPFEGLYAEVVNMGLVERLQRDYSINIAGPSTMAAMLNSLQMGFRTLAIQKKSGDVWKILEAAKKEFSTFETVLTKTRERLKQADDELDKLVGTRTRAINRKLSDVSVLTSDSDADNLLEIIE